MTDSEVAGAARPSRRLTVLTLLAWGIIALVLPLTALTLNAVQIAGFPLGFWFAAQGALVGLAGLAWLFVFKAGGVHGRESVLGPLVFAGEAIASAGFVGYAGLIAALGYDALSYPLGVAAGLTLMTVLVAPRFVLYPVSSVAGFFTARFGGLWPRRLLLAVTGMASVLLLAADIRGAGLAVEALTGFPTAPALALVAVVLSGAWFALALGGGRRRFGVVFAVLLATFSVMLIVLALTQSRLPLPYWSYGFALQDVATLEISLISQKLADVRALKPIASPFLQMSMWNFAGLVLAVALGLAAFPQLLGRHLSQSHVAPGEAPRRTAMTLTLVAVFLCGLAPFAVFARVALADLVKTGIKLAELPASMTDASARGWLEICGQHSGDATELAAACAKAGGSKGVLRLQDLSFNNDAYLFTAARIAGLPDVLWLLVVIAALLAALIAGNAILSGFLAADAEARRSGPPEAQRLDLRSVALGILLLFGAVAFAALSPADIVSLASEGLALLAASVFPALILALYWRRFGAPGAIATLVTGFAAAAIYIFGIRFVPGAFFDVTGHLSTAPPSATAKLNALRGAVEAATDPAARAAAEAALYRHAVSVANWWGLRPAAAVLFALPAAVLMGVAVTLMTARRGT